MDWQTLIDEYLTHLRAADRSPETIKLARYQLTRMADDLPRSAATTTTEDLERWLSGHGWAAETVRSHRARARLFWAWAVARGHLAHDPARELPPVAPARHVARPANDAAWRRAVALGGRVGLMVALGARLGLRRAEIAQVSREDVVSDLGGWSLVVHGKGRRERMIPLPRDLAEQLLDQEPGWVFPSPRGGHLTPSHVGKLVSAALGGGGAHQLRHRCATTAYAATGDLLVVQQLLGHAKPETTAGYVLVGRDRLRQAVAAAA